MFVGFANVNSTPCPLERLALRPAGRHRSHFLLRRLDPLPWLLISVVLTATGFVLFLARRR